MKNWWKYSDAAETLRFLAALVCIIAVLLGSVFGVANWSAKRSCLNYGEMTGYEVKWITLDACYVKRDGRWYREGVDAIEIVEDRSK